MSKPEGVTLLVNWSPAETHCVVDSPSCDSCYRLEQIIITSFLWLVRDNVLDLTRLLNEASSLTPSWKPFTAAWAAQRKSRRKKRTKTGERQSLFENCAAAAAAAVASRKKNTTANCKPRPQALHIPPSPTSPPPPPRRDRTFIRAAICSLADYKRSSSVDTRATD